MKTAAGTMVRLRDVLRIVSIRVVLLTDLAIQTVSAFSYASFGDFNPTLIRPSNSSHPYCSYFQNRVPHPAPELNNCTWYKKESCCRQVELDAIFKDLKPIPGADENCLKMLNAMICWVCDPTQNSFYSSSKMKLTFCESFCNRLLAACQNAVFKGQPMGISYINGTQMCRSHNFMVPDDPRDKKCFSSPAYGPDRDAAAHWTSPAAATPVLLLLFSLLLYHHNYQMYT